MNMKKSLKAAASLLCAFALCMSMGCSDSGSSASGLGSLDMSDSSDSSSSSVGSLGGSDKADDSGIDDGEPDESSTDSGKDTDTGSDSGKDTSSSGGSDTSGSDSGKDTSSNRTGTSTLSTTTYSSENVNMTIPAGWTVHDIPYVTDAGQHRLIITVTDPSDKGNTMWFSTAMEPFFTSKNDRDTWKSTTNHQMFDWAPILSEVSAAGVVEQWGAFYTLMQMDGLFDSYFNNYNLQEVVLTNVAEDATAADTVSETVCEVKVPGLGNNDSYVMYLYDDLVKTSVANMPSYYISYSNLGMSVSINNYESYFETMLTCLFSLDISPFNQKYLNSSSSGIVADDGSSVREWKPTITKPVDLD